MRKGAGNRGSDNHLTPCMPGATVNVPVHLVDNFPENLLVVRSGAPGALVERIDDDLGERIGYVQLTDLDADPSPFIRWKQTSPDPVAGMNRKGNSDIRFRGLTDGTLNLILRSRFEEETEKPPSRTSRKSG